MSKSKKEIRVVGIGASAGGLEALQDFFKYLPENSGMAYVVVQHLSPDYKSLMDELLAKQTSMPIKVISDGLALHPDHVYLIPPRKNLRLFKNKLFLTDQDPQKGLNLPIDIFFRSLAEEKGKNAIGIILSGTGSDGTMGTRAIKEVSGMIMVQDESTAKFNGMPASAISTGLVDYILPPKNMGNELLNYLKHPFVEKVKKGDSYTDDDLDSLTKATMILRDYIGIDFSYYKENTIRRRLERRVSINRFNTMEEYILYLNDSDQEKEILYRELLIGVTHFFRDKEAFGSLSKNGLKAILENSPKNIRVWSTGCSTGEEVYSIAIQFMELVKKYGYSGEIKIFATDIDRKSIEVAGKGFYPESIVADVDSLLLEKYFTKTEGGYKVNEEIRNMVVFAVHNVLKDPPFSKLDLLVCRNLFIYLKPDVQSKLLSRFYYSLKSEGYLFMGSSETLGGMTEAFEIIDTKNKIFRYKPGYQPTTINELGIESPGRNYDYRRELRSRKVKRFKSDELIEAVVGDFIPPSVIVDSNHFIITIINDINPYTEIQRGSYSNELFSILPKELGLFVSNLLRQLKKEKDSVIYRDINTLESFKGRSIHIEGRKLLVEDSIYYMVTFSDNKVKADSTKNKEEAESFNLTEEQSSRVLELEKELKSVKENLAATVEELESSNEELQSSNEELIASNEELQSTNEELQSVNEELYTVNSEHQVKIQELTRLNNDINNLLKNTEVAAVYLDSKLCIRKTTPELSKITHILDTDIGRPITHISVMENYKEIVDDVIKVIDDLQPIDKEITDDNGVTYFTRIRPYRTEHNAVDGVLVTFVNITETKKLKREINASNAMLSDSLERSNMAWWELDVKNKKLSFDERRPAMLGYTKKEFTNTLSGIFKIMHKDDLDKAKSEVYKVIDGKNESWDIRYRLKSKGGEYIWFHNSGKVSRRDNEGNPLKVIGTVINITDTVNLSEDLHRNKELRDLVLLNSPLAITLLDSEGNIEYANKTAEKVLGITQNEIMNRSYNDEKWEITGTDGKSLKNEELPFSVVKKTLKPVYDYKHYLKIPKKKKALLSIDGAPVLSDDKRFEGAVFTIKVVKEG